MSAPTDADAHAQDEREIRALVDRPLPTSGLTVELGGRVVRWRTNRARSKQHWVREPSTPWPMT